MVPHHFTLHLLSPVHVIRFLTESLERAGRELACFVELVKMPGAGPVPETETVQCEPARCNFPNVAPLRHPSPAPPAPGET